MSRFCFQQFAVEHDCSSMKVGTDAVLLGALAEISGKEKILEVGCGCGVISLMLAQRFPEADFLAIDLHSPSVEEARNNFLNSPFSARLQACLCRLQDMPTTERFDGIVSNPPFFRRSSKSPHSARSLARHTIDLDLPTLFQTATTLLHDDGSLQIILPASDRIYAQEEAEKCALYLRKNYAIYARKELEPKRSILLFQKQKGAIAKLSIPLHEGAQASAEYQALMGDFLTIYQSK